MGLQMTRAMGYNSLSTGVFVPEIWSKMMQKKYYARTCISEILNHRWEGEIKNKGDKVNIRVRPDITINDYEVGGNVTYQDIADSSLTLLIDKAKYWAFKDDDIDRHQADIEYVKECTDDAAQQMKITVEQDVFATVYAQTHADNAMASQVITKANVLDWIVDAGVKLDVKNVPEDGRWIVLPPWICGMIKKSELKDASIMGDDESALRKGRIGMIDRFTVYANNNISTSSGTYRCVAGHPDFCCFASQFVKTDLGIRLEGTFGDGHRGLKVYGYKVTKPEAGVYMPATAS
jgi:hypothetical protein